MTTKAKPEKNATDVDGLGQDRAIGPGGQGHAKNVRDRVTGIATAEDEKFRTCDGCFVQLPCLVLETSFVTLCCKMLMSCNITSNITAFPRRDLYCHERLLSTDWRY